MADRRPAARMQLVEVEDAPTAADRSRPVDNPPPQDHVGVVVPAPAGVRVLRRWWPVAVVVVLGVVATGLVLSARDRAFVARIAAVPGLVRPLSAAPEPLWETRGSTLPGTVLAADGALVVLAEGERAWTVTSHDATSGAQRWAVDVAPVSSSGFEATAAVCPPLRGDAGDLVVCLVRHPRVLYSDDASIQELPRVMVVPLSAQDGERLGDWEVRGELVAFDRVEDDLVIGTLDDEGRMIVQRRDARTGDVVWSIVTPVVMNAPAITVAAAMRVLPPLVVLDGGATIVLDVEDGSTLMTGPRFGGLQVAALGDRFATWSPADGGRVHDVDGTALFGVQGLPAQLSADDGSERGTIIVDEGPQVAAVDATTGAQKWRTPSQLDPRLLVSDRLVVSGADRYGVLDASDGSMLWDVVTGEVLTWDPVSDGTLVLGPGTSPDGRPELWGRGLEDGVRYWSVPLPEGVRRVDSVGGHLVVRTENDLIVYG
ncbi:outer membrane protein assembly factor BamB family protein [Cellulomonas sp. P5_C5]